MIITKREGLLASPGFPAVYPPDTSCQWIFTAVKNTLITLSFLYIDIEDEGSGKSKF